MFGVLTVERTRPKNWLESMCMCLFPQRYIEIGGFNYRMAAFKTAKVRLPEKASPKREHKMVDRALKKLKGIGVHRVVTQPGYDRFLPGHALMPVDRKQAMHACIAKAAVCAAKDCAFSLENLCVTVYAKRGTKDISRGILTLAGEVRTIKLKFDIPSIPLEDHLLQNYGIACRGEGPQGADNLCLFLDRAEDVGGCIAVNLTGEPISGENIWEPELTCDEAILGKRPKGITPDDFTAALCLAGGITPEEIDVKKKMKSALT